MALVQIGRPSDFPPAIGMQKQSQAKDQRAHVQGSMAAQQHVVTAVQAITLLSLLLRSQTRVVAFPGAACPESGPTCTRPPSRRLKS